MPPPSAYEDAPVAYVVGPYVPTTPRHRPAPAANAAMANLVKHHKHLLHTQGKPTSRNPPRTVLKVQSPQAVARPGPVVDDGSLAAFLEEHRAAVIGGAIVHDISLLIGDTPAEGGKGPARVQLRKLPVLPHQIPDSEGARAQLQTSSVAGAVPVFVFPEDYIAPPGYGHVTALPPAEGTTGASGELTTVHMDMYTVSGDIDNFWGVKGLTATLHKHKEVKAKSRTEKVTLDPQSLAFKGQPLASLFPFIDSGEFKKLPVANLELTYSSGDSNNPLHKAGLRLEVDVQLRDSLQFVGDAIKRLFGSPDHPPTIHLSAWLSETRNWSQHPANLDKVVFQGYFRDMSFKPWDLVEFKTMGIELTAMKSGATWDFGFGFIGEAMISNIPEAGVPVGLSYRIAREVEADSSVVKALGMGRMWTLTLVAQDWRHVFGFENVNMTKTILSASFNEVAFGSSVKLDITGVMKIGDVSLEIQGQFAKGWKHAVTWTWVQFQNQRGAPLPQEDHFLQASIGNLTLSDIRKLYSRIVLGCELAEQDGSDGGAGETLKLQNATIKVSCTKYLGNKPDRKALEVLGAVTVGDISSYSASLTFATDGFTITGGVGNIQIPGTNLTIEKAGLKFTMALKGKPQKALPTGAANTQEKGKGAEGNKRNTSLAVLGVVKYQDVIFKAGLYLANKKDSKERDWLAFGSAGHVRLREIWPSIPEDSFLNLQLDNVAIVASSQDRPHTIDREQNDDGSANWDVLSEIGAYHYPISKGFQICATISSFLQLEQLNGGKKIEGLMLVLSISPEGEVKVAITLPPSFRVELSKFAALDDFGATISVGENGEPQLQLTATLTVMMEASDPIVVHGVLVGTLQGVSGELYMDPASKWVNPFGLNEALVLSNLGIGAGFDYATVLETGPNRLALKGQVDIGDDFHGRLDVGFDVAQSAAVLQVELSTLDLADLARMAGILAQCATLQEMPAKTVLKPGDVVFHDLRLYLSSGARFLGQYYPRGVQVRGALEVLGHAGVFEGSFTDDGVVVAGALRDALSLGGLEVSSLSSLHAGGGGGGDGKGRGAAAHVELTRTRQRVLVDGAVRYRGMVVGVIVDVDLQKRYLYAKMEMEIAGSLGLALKGSLDVGTLPRGGQRGPGAAVWMFEGALKPDVVAAVAEGILGAIDTLNTMAKHKIDEAEAKIKAQLGARQDELARQEHELDELRRQSRVEVLKRRGQIDEKNAALRRANEEIDEAERRYRELKARKDTKDAELEAQRRKRDQAQAALERKTREMRKEYDAKIQEQKDNQAHWKSEKQRLIEKKNASWGDELRKKEAADKNWAWWTRVENERWEWKKTCQRNLDNCHWWEKAYWGVKLAEAAAGLEEAHLAKAVEAELFHAAEAVLNNDVVKAVEWEIKKAADEAEKFATALGKLVTDGPVAYIAEMTRDEKGDLDRQIRHLGELIEDSQHLQEALEAAGRDLERTRGRLSPEQERARGRIAQLEAEIKLKPFEDAYRDKKQEFDKIKSQVDGLVVALGKVKDAIDVEGVLAQQVIRLVESGVPRIKEVRVRASSDALTAHKPLALDITAAWLGRDHVCHVEWAPEQDTHVLYDSAAKRLAALGDSVDYPQGGLVPLGPLRAMIL